jgi:DNA (cytosine-5)-methyltransferase 1
VASTLLPTPRATDGTKGGPNQGGSSGDLMLPSAVQLLPTPRSQNGEERNQNIWARPLDQPQNLKNALARLEDE